MSPPTDSSTSSVADEAAPAGNTAADKLHEVRIHRRDFDYEPVVELPSWWTPGDRRRALEGETVTVNGADYQRGLRLCAFEDTPALPARTVTIAHGTFWYTPVPFPKYRREGYTATAMRGDTIEVLEEDYLRGVRHKAFSECWSPSRFGDAGEPAVRGSSIDFLNWVRGADRAALELLCSDLDDAVSSDGTEGSARSQQYRDVAEIRGLLLDQGVRDRALPIHVERAFDLIRPIYRTPGDDETEATEFVLQQIRDGEITDPDVIRVLLDRAGQGEA